MAGGGQSLLGPNAARAIAPQFLATGGHGAGTDQDHLAARLPERRNAGGQASDNLAVQAVVRGQYRAAHLDHHAPGIVQRRLA